jgi:rubredoxin
MTRKDLAESTVSDDGPSAVRPCDVYLCTVCGWLYEEANGLPEADIPAGTRWADVAADFLCPECGVGKEEFEKVEI